MTVAAAVVAIASWLVMFGLVAWDEGHRDAHDERRAREQSGRDV